MKQNSGIRLIGRCGALALAAVLSCGAFAACKKQPNAEQNGQTDTADLHQKEFTDAGVTVTLSDSFKKSTVTGYTIAYEATDSLLLGLKENDSSLNGKTLDQYANLVISNNASLQGISVKHDDGLTYFEFESTVDDVTYRYFAAVYQNGDDYWLMQFASQKKDYNAKRADFVKYAKSVRFS